MRSQNPKVEVKMFKKDSYVQHPGMPDWGIGKVLEDVVVDIKPGSYA